MSGGEEARSPPPGRCDRGLVRVGEIVENRAFCPMIAVAMASQGGERPSHPLQFGDLRLERCDMIQSNPLHIGAGAGPVAP